MNLPDLVLCQQIFMNSFNVYEASFQIMTDNMLHAK
jgi:hypothetical protein